MASLVTGPFHTGVVGPRLPFRRRRRRSCLNLAAAADGAIPRWWWWLGGVRGGVSGSSPHACSAQAPGCLAEVPTASPRCVAPRREDTEPLGGARSHSLTAAAVRSGDVVPSHMMHLHPWIALYNLVQLLVAPAPPHFSLHFLTFSTYESPRICSIFKPPSPGKSSSAPSSVSPIPLQRFAQTGGPITSSRFRFYWANGAHTTGMAKHWRCMLTGDSVGTDSTGPTGTGWQNTGPMTGHGGLTGDAGSASSGRRPASLGAPCSRPAPWRVRCR